MIKHLRLQNFTVFKDAELEFSRGLNVIIGENGAGKTHLLKLGYMFSNAWHALVNNQNYISEHKVEQYFSERLVNIFKPDKVGNLSSTGGDGKSMVSASLLGTIPTVQIGLPSNMPGMTDEITWQFSFSNRSIDHIDLQEKLTSNAKYGKGVYLPSKEMLSFFEGFSALYEKREISIDETYKDLALHLETPKLKTIPPILKKTLADLSCDVGGGLELKGGKFYLVSGNSVHREMTLVAEGIIKLATLMRLIENGSLEVGDTLFWDEPEVNFNPKLIKAVAADILSLCKNGFQVIIGTHSLFLLRELEILASQKPYLDIPQRYFALSKQEDFTNIQQGNSVDEINPLIMLDEELAQSDRFINMGNA
ncbi:MAG: AAA family ATPase [Methylomonas sp.]|jgi:AAA15 family ATPase/GTPase